MILEHLIFFPLFLSSHALTTMWGLFLGISLGQAISSIERKIKDGLDPPFGSWDLSLLAQYSESGCLVRLASSHDDEAIDHIEGTCFPAGLLSEECEKDLEESSLLTLVVVMHQGIVGYVSLSAQCDTIHVESLAILPDYRLRVTLPFLQIIRNLLLQNQVDKISALCREKTIYRLLKKHGTQLGFTVFSEEKQEEMLQGEFFYRMCLLIQPV